MNGADATSLWSQLKQAGLVEGDAPAETLAVTPWYIRTMLGIAGWIGAMFLLGFVGAAFSIVMKSAGSGLAAGALLCAAATFMFRARPNGDFFNQFALAVSIAGQALICVGFGQLFTTQIALVAFLVALLEAGLFFLIPNFLHRVLSVAAGAGSLVIALSIWGFYPYTQAVVFVAFAWAWLNEFRFPDRGAELRALGYGLTLLVIAELVTHSSMDWWRSAWMGRGEMALIGGALGFWIGAALVGAITIWAAWTLLVRQGVDIAKGPGLAALGGAVLVALISIKAPGLGVTVTILLLGYANGNRVLAGLGILALVAYWSYYYYSLEITLLQKSAVLFSAGIVLIAARQAMRRRWPVGEGKEAGHA
ncbi:MAG TPA: DUF4401 domain-containing protein [Burkholderiales bacterium]|nr:DUF4401 domain-containing protein [Burkholderiales bacterium]